MGKRKRERQPTMWVATIELPSTASHPLYARLNQLLREHSLTTSRKANAPSSTRVQVRLVGVRPAVE
jgi:hypothetical protein